MLLTLLMLVLVFLGMPISFALGVSSAVFLLYQGVPLVALPQRMAVSVDSFPLLAVPFFVLTGALMNTGGVTRRIFALANSLVGHITGGLAHVTVVANMFFAGISGAAVADAAALGPVMIDAMHRQGMPRDFAAAVTASASTIGPIIPPSIIFIIYAMSARISIAKMFLAGIVPGFVIAAFMMLWIYYVTKTGKEKSPLPEKLTRSQKWNGFKGGILASMTPFIILWGMVGGMVTPTEAGILAIAWAFIIGVVHREIDYKGLPSLLYESAVGTAHIMVLIGIGTLMGYVIALDGTPDRIANLLTTFTTNKYVMLFMINIFLLILGCLIEPTPALLLTYPILEPIISAYGIDPLHFGMIICYNLTIGMLMPPIGLGLYVMCSIADVKFEPLFKACIPFIIVNILALFLITYFPALSVWFPNWVMS